MSAKNESLNPAIQRIDDYASMAKMYPLIRQLNTDMSEAVYLERLQAIAKQGNYFQIVCYLGDKAVGLSGVWISTQIWCGKLIEVDNFIVDEKYRKHGVGQLMLEWIENKGREENCLSVQLDSYVTADKAHRFYFRHGYKVRGFHMTKDF